MSTVDYAELEATQYSICSQLGINKNHIKKSWDIFKNVNENYTLDGNPLHWLACILYVECLNFVKIVSVGQTGEERLNLLNILKRYNLSFLQFINKINIWMEMTSTPTYIRIKFSKMERKFEVSILLFQKFQSVFKEIFIVEDKKAVEEQKTLSPKNLIDFTWCLYLCVKEEFNQTSDNLVDMYHMLLSCVDYIFENVFLAKKKYLLNPKFKGLPKHFNTSSYVFPRTAPCIISILCNMKKCSLIEVTSAKQYSLRPVIESFFKKKLILNGDGETLTGILLPENYKHNIKSLNKTYETIILSSGEFDERVFLEENSEAIVGSQKTVRYSDSLEIMESLNMGNRPSAPDTPLTGRRYLKSRTELLTPVSEATNSIVRLRAYLSGCKAQPSAQLLQLFNECGIDAETIASCVTSPCKQWAQQFSSSFEECSNETVVSRTNMVTTLHYKVLEHIVKGEIGKKPHVPLHLCVLSLLKQEVFQATVYTCCAEVVLHAYGTHVLRFPRVLTIFQISAFHFYKIIELVVLATMEKLSRDVIKHLNAVEEQVLESLVWTSDSPLWSKIGSGDDPTIPASTVVYSLADSPLPASKQNRNVMQSLTNSSVDQAKKQLFIDNIKPGQSLLVKEMIVPSPAKEVVTINTETPTTPNKGKKSQSLVLFFRKFYSLAVVRMNYLCNSLRLTDDELKMKIWTCLEHSIMHQVHLMRDRHLDQILMCAVYVICKVSNSITNPVERSFTEIMRCYRQQPQADNHVYRSVLIGDESPDERGDLIKFYNKVYVQCMQTFALRFTGKHKDECSLSPLPTSRGLSVRGGGRVSERHQLWVRPLTSPPPHAQHLSYRFSRSPAKDLHAINSMLSCELGTAKRPQEPADDNSVVKRTKFDTPASVARKLQVLISDRQTV